MLNELILYWFLFVSISAAIGSIIGTLLAFGIRSGSTKLTKWYRSL